MDEQGYRPSEGSCIISEDVIATIASTAALDVAGVASMASRPADIRRTGSHAGHTRDIERSGAGDRGNDIFGNNAAAFRGTIPLLIHTMNPLCCLLYTSRCV